MTKHSITPWQYKIYGEKVHIFNEGRCIAILNSSSARHSAIDVDEANAAHIVKCVNLHDEMIKALEFYADEKNYSYEVCLMPEQPFEGIDNEIFVDLGAKARAVLAKAKGDI